MSRVVRCKKNNPRLNCKARTRIQIRFYNRAPLKNKGEIEAGVSYKQATPTGFLTETAMMLSSKRPTLAEALAAAKNTRALEIGSKILQKTPEFFEKQFGDKPAVIAETTAAIC